MSEKKLVDPYEIIRDGEASFKDKSIEDLINPVEIVPEDTKSFEEKLYIILLFEENNDNLVNGSFCIALGRTECYRKIQTLLEAFGDTIDIHEGKVIVETNKYRNNKPMLMPYDDCISIYSFCKSVENYYSGSIKFDIELYNYQRSSESSEDSNEDDSVTNDFIAEMNRISASLKNDDNSNYHVHLPILNEDDSQNV